MDTATATIDSRYDWQIDQTSVKVKFEHEGNNYALLMDSDEFVQLIHQKGALIKGVTLKN